MLQSLKFYSSDEFHLRRFRKQNLNSPHSEISAPTVSAIVLSYNHGPYILDCIASLIRQRTDNTEIIVLDDHSIDNSADIVKELASQHVKIHLLLNESNTGNIALNTQKLIEASCGSYILFMAGDDQLASTYDLRAALDLMERDGSVGLVIPRLKFLNESGGAKVPEIYDPALLSALRSSDPQEILSQHLFKRVSRIFLQGVVLRRSVLDEMGGFTSGTISDDYAFFMRLFNHLQNAGQKFFFDEKSEWLYRIHANNIHRNAVRQFTSILEVVSRFVPQEHWRLFKWDSVIFTKYEDLETAIRSAQYILGTSAAQRLVRAVSRRAVSAAGKRGDRLFLRRFIADKNNNFHFRLRAALKLAHCLLKAA